VTIIVDLPVPGVAMGLGLKVTPWAFPCPVADRVIAESKPFSAAVVTVEVAELPLATVIAVGDALMLKSAFSGAVTVRATLVVFVMPPPVPVTVIVYVPAAVVEATAIFMVEVPEPGAAIDVGLNLTLTPVGWPVADKAIAESKPSETAVVIVEVPLFPRTTETEVGEAEIVIGVGG
jgi:hypothetical protein